MPVGRVKWYDKTKGFGFIESAEGDVFFHFTDIQMEGFKALAEDQRVSYTLVRSDQGLKARQVCPLDNRAAVRRAARYRCVFLMRIQPGREEDFDRFISTPPAWLDAMEQDLGLRRIGDWRHGCQAVHLVESDRPFAQSIELARQKPCWQQYEAYQKELGGLLESEPLMMPPILCSVPGQEPAGDGQHAGAGDPHGWASPPGSPN